MRAPLVLLAALGHCLVTATIVLLDFSRLLTITVRSRRALAAENLFLRKQLALFQEREVKPRRANDSTRWIMATLSRFFEWRTLTLRFLEPIFVVKSAENRGASNRVSRRNTMSMSALLRTRM